MKLLIAADDKLNRTLLSKLMQKMGVECIPAEDGQQALDIALAEDFDAIFLDINMPLMQGPECAEKIRKNAKENNRKLPVLVCISADDEYSDDPLFDFALFKPFMSENILNFLNALSECKKEMLYDFDDVSEKIGLDNETMLMLMDEFISVMDEEYLNLRNAVYANDKEMTTHTAHKMKGAAAGMMVTGLQELCAEMQNADKSDRDNVKLSLIRIHCCYNKFRALFTR